MVQIVDIDGSLTKALLAIRNLRARAVFEGWHVAVLTQALAFAIAIDEHAARSSHQGETWALAVKRGRELAAAIIAEEGGSP